jgi:CRISPR/Cas system CMR subunit Cmr4 (Cas7 group RAMP superfamily)
MALTIRKVGESYSLQRDDSTTAPVVVDGSALRIALREYCTDSHAEDVIRRLGEGHQSVTVEKQAVLLNENDEVPEGGQE